MVSPFIYAAIRKRAKNENVAIPKNLTQILRKYQLIKHSSKYKIVFWWAHDPFATVLNGSPMMPSAVILNHVWASRVGISVGILTRRGRRESFTPRILISTPIS
jgi:hypothetical protein